MSLPVRRPRTSRVARRLGQIPTEWRAPCALLMARTTPSGRPAASPTSEPRTSQDHRIRVPVPSGSKTSSPSISGFGILEIEARRRRSVEAGVLDGHRDRSSGGAHGGPEPAACPDRVVGDQLGSRPVRILTQLPTTRGASRRLLHWSRQPSRRNSPTSPAIMVLTAPSTPTWIGAAAQGQRWRRSWLELSSTSRRWPR